MEPHVPLVKAQFNVLFTPLFGFDKVAHRANGADEPVHVVRLGQKAVGVVQTVAIVGVQGDVIHAVVGFLQHRGLPLGVGGHAGVGAAAHHQLQAGVDLPQGLGGLVGQMAVFQSGFVAHLPGAVHFVAQAPNLKIMGPGHAMGDAQVAVFAAGGVVAVLHQAAGRVDAPGAQVNSHHNIGPGLFCPAGKLVYANEVGLRAAPSQVQALGTLGHRAHAVLPEIVGDKIAAWVADNGHADLPDQIQHVPAEALLIGGGMAGLVNAAINSAAQVFNKRAIDALVNAADLKVRVQGDAGKSFFHRVGLLSQ